MNTIEKKKKHYSNNIEHYMNYIINRYACLIPTNKKLLKLDDDELNMLTIKNYIDITKYNYNLSQLKNIAKHYKLRLSGNKKELSNRIYIFLHLSSYIIKIQKIFRGNLQRKFNNYFGPALKNRNICINKTDFITMDDLTELNYPQFFSYKDVDGFVYGFDISSLYNLIFKTNYEKNTSKYGGINPYNRKKIPCDVIITLKMIFKTSKLLNINVSVSLDNNIGQITNEKSVELRALSLFQAIDSLGNYSSPNWFLSLTRNQLIKFVRELSDIWNYRAQLSIEIKRNICPPLGDPFRNINIASITYTNDDLIVKKLILDILEKFVNNGIDKDCKSLGAYYVLGALTLVNDSAASSLPWLFQSVSYF